MFEVSFPRHGAILNHNHGRESAEGLEILVTGIGGASGQVTVNGVPADFDGTGFAAKVTLRQRVNTITVALADTRGTLTRQMQVIWDKGSFKRYNFFIDDNIFFLTDIARERPASIFEHFYLKFLRELHRKYGLKVTLNCFFENAHDPAHFTLDQFPADYKGQFEDNSDWMRLAFHARAEFPDRPYQNADSETIAQEYDRFNAEVVRFAGEKSLGLPVGLHWAMCRPEAIKVLTDRGVHILEGQFINPRTGIADAGTPELVCDVGYFANLDDARYLEAQGILWDFRHDVCLLRGDCTVNLWSCPQILEKVRHAAQGSRDLISLATHEQYSFPYYFNYLADHGQRMETAIRTATELGYAPVFFAEGFFGNRAWE